jgi:predicted short-subunit dehydrogenase-like oxidoreductase (DUF2520 family)
VASHLGLYLLKKGYNIKQVWSRQLIHAEILAEKLNSLATDDLCNIKNADLYIVSVKDDVLSSVIQQLEVNNIVHTSGAIGLEVFNNRSENYGVLYPLQTFNKNVNLDLSKTPMCIEANNKLFKNQLMNIGDDLSNQVIAINSQKRKQLHIAAVFACNFTNHMFSIAASILAKSDINFKLLLPIINQTVKKLNQNKPSQVQTGPAKRKDKKIMQSHINNISSKETKEIYKLMSNAIMRNND